MMRSPRRGQPLLTLFVLLGGWIALRTVLWQSPFARAIGPAAIAAISPRKPARQDAPPQTDHLVAVASSVHRSSGVPSQTAAWAIAAEPQAAPITSVPLELVPPGDPDVPPAFARSANAPTSTPAAAPFQPVLPPREASKSGRWSADAWVLAREDTTAAVTSGRGSYGQSQAGVVVRYRLAPASGLRPSAYLRASQALAGAKESEAALGLSARPIPGVPVSAAAELRATRIGGAVHFRPAVYAVSELPPLRLPLDIAAEAYAQAGYVWGDYRTAFIDGQLRTERPIVRFEYSELRVGAGAWGGAQKGAARLDVGPSATLATKLGPAPLRISLDWRFRVAGNANPASGPSLTVAAGF